MILKIKNVAILMKRQNNNYDPYNNMPQFFIGTNNLISKLRQFDSAVYKIEYKVRVAI